MVDVTAMGTVRPRRVLTRAGGRPGDELYVTGSLGAAAAGLALLEKGFAGDLEPELAGCVERFNRPEARGRIGVTVARRRAASAAMDLSDGLADAVRQLAGASGTGAVVDASTLPVHPGARVWCALTGRDPIELAISGGEDYELLFAVPRRLRRSFLAALGQAGAVPATCIGRLEREPGITLDRAGTNGTVAGWIRPLLGLMASWKKFWERWMATLLRIDDTPKRTSLAFGLGALVGFSPFLGLHTVIGLMLAFIFRLNRVAVLAGVWLNLPWIMAPYYAGATIVGGWLTGFTVPPRSSTTLN